MSRELQMALLGNAAFSQEFFSLQSPVDSPPEVLAILQKIHQTEPALFADYQSLALAIAVVYDVPPPPNWPHGQVNATALPRKLQPPEHAFAYRAQPDPPNLTTHPPPPLPSTHFNLLS